MLIVMKTKVHRLSSFSVVMHNYICVCVYEQCRITTVDVQVDRCVRTSGLEII